MTETPAPDTRPLLIAFSHLRWDFVTQRPQHLLSRAAADYRVVFIEEPIRHPGEQPYLHHGPRAQGVEVVQPHVPDRFTEAQSIDYQREVVDSIAAQAATPPLLWYYTPMALPFSRHVEAWVIVFDKMDELSVFKGAPPALIELEQELLDLVDVVFTGGASMHEASAHRHANIHCFPSSIDTGHFAAARTRSLADPADQTEIARPRIGFFGVIDERMDVDLLGEVAALRPDWQFVILGPVVKIDPATLPRTANIHWLGGKDYRDLPAYLSHWDIGWMPFAINESTKFISPTKTPEFLAAGLPVVSTAIRDVIRPYAELGLVEIATTAAETVSAIETLLNAPRASWLARVDAQLAKGSWDRTWAAMQAQIDTVITPPATTIEKELAHV